MRCSFHLRCSAAIQVSFFPFLLNSMHCSAAVLDPNLPISPQACGIFTLYPFSGCWKTGVQVRKFIFKGLGVYRQRESGLDKTLLFMCLKWISFLWAIYPRLFCNTYASCSSDLTLWGHAHEIKHSNFYVCFHFPIKTAIQIYRLFPSQSHLWYFSLMVARGLT